MQGLKECGATTLGSLFDGISGFPYAGLLEGIYPVWSAEWMEYQQTVIRHHFGDEEQGLKGDCDEWMEEVRKEVGYEGIK